MSTESIKARAWQAIMEEAKMKVKARKQWLRVRLKANEEEAKRAAHVLEEAKRIAKWEAQIQAWEEVAVLAEAKTKEKIKVEWIKRWRAKVARWIA